MDAQKLTTRRRNPSHMYQKAAQVLHALKLYIVSNSGFSSLFIFTVSSPVTFRVLLVMRSDVVDRQTEAYQCEPITVEMV